MNDTIRRSAIVVAVVAGACVLVPAAVSSTPTFPVRPAAVTGVGHKVLYPTVEAAQARRVGAAPEAVAAPLAYGGGINGIGVTTGPPKVYLVFWGSQWGTATTSGATTSFSNDAKGVAPRLQLLFKGIGTNNERWSGVNTQYCEGVSKGATSCPASSSHVGYPTKGAFAGIWYDNSAAAPNLATDHQLAVESVNAAAHFGNITPASNRNAQYVIASASGLHPAGFNTIAASWCAWHDWSGDTTLSGGAAASSYGDIAFTNLPYLPDKGASCGANFVNTGTAGALDGVTMIGGHEYAETITDQNPAGGWMDPAGLENADKCAWAVGAGGAQNITFSTGSFAMQGTWSNDTGACAVSHPTVTNAPVANDFGLSVSPATGSAAAGTSLSATVSTAVTSGTSQSVSLTATGQPTGVTVSFSPASVTAGSASKVTIASTTAVVAGTYPITVKGAGTSLSHTATYNLTVTRAACASPGQKIANPGFESGATSWTGTTGDIGTFAGEPAHGGTKDVWLDGHGTTRIDSVAQTVAIPSGCSSYSLSFYLHVDTAETTTTSRFDTLTVTLGTTTVASFSNLDKAPGYVLKTFNVSGFAGQTVALKFQGAEDSTFQTSFVVDDSALSVA